MEIDLQARLLQELHYLLAPIIEAVEHPELLPGLLHDLGWTPETLPGRVFDDLQAALAEIQPVIAALEAPPQDLMQAAKLAFDLVELGARLAKLPQVFVELVDAGPKLAEQLAGEFVEYLLLDYLSHFYRPVHAGLVLLGLITHTPARAPTFDRERPVLIHRGGRRAQLDGARLLALLQDPIATVRAAYQDSEAVFGPEFADTPDTEILDALLARIGALFSASGLPVYAVESDLEPSRRGVRIRFGDYGELLLLPRGPSWAEAKVEAQASGELALTRTIGDFQFESKLSGDLPRLEISRDGVEVLDGVESVRVDLGLARLLEPGEDFAIIFGSKSGTRVEFGPFRFDAFAKFPKLDFGLSATLTSCKLVLDWGDLDGFLRKVMSGGRIEAQFGLGVAWSLAHGFEVSGQGGLELRRPLHLNIAEVFELSSLMLAMRVEPHGLALEAGVGAKLELGPLSASVERIGLRASVSFPSPQRGPSPGFELNFLPPTGVGLAIDAGPLTGGGYLEFDIANERYAGVLALSLLDIAITAIGLITTRLPNGKPGFSMLINIGVVFDPPIELSMGFTLSGVGGLVGINRTMKTEALQAGIRKGTLNSLLFPNPASIIADAPQIIADMRKVFPPAEGRFVVGPMLKVGWGTPNLIQADVGVFIELPDPIKIALLGKVQARLPDKGDPIVKLNLFLLGILDLERCELSFQSSIYDSSILGLVLFGDSAFLLRWGNKPQFALSFGGFHPEFDPPPPSRIFSGLNRMMLTISYGKEIMLMCQAYQALTPNSLQFGARVMVLVNVGPLFASGSLGFDALFYFSPFRFSIRIDAEVIIRFDGHTLAAIDVDFRLSGPTPWCARGTANFKILFFDVKASFNISWGRTHQKAVPTIDPVPPLLEALTQPGNWGSRPPGRGQSEVVLAPLQPAGAEVLVDPAGRLEARQKVLPLGLRLDKIGNKPVRDHNCVEIEAVQIGQTPASGLDLELREDFARGQFQELSATRRLSGPGFERFRAGVRFGSSNLAIGGEFVEHEPGWEEFGLEFEPPDDDDHARLLNRRAARRASVHPRGRFASGKPPLLTNIGRKFVVVSADDLTPVVPDGAAGAWFSTQAEAEQALADHLSHPGNHGAPLQVVADYEVVES